MNNWIRREDMEDSYNDLHSVKPVIYWQRVNNSTYNVKLQLGGKEIILQEELEKGLTKTVTLTYDNQITPFNSMYDAEKKATELLRS